MTSPEPGSSPLEARAHTVLLGNFTPIDRTPARVPVIVRGEGCYVYDDAGRRYLDGLAALFCVNVGHGREELAEAAAAQARQLAFFHAWGMAHPPVIELAERIVALAGGPFRRAFFTSGGSESVESAIKLARSYHLARGDERRVKVIARDLAYHGTSLGALAATGIPGLRGDYEPLIPDFGRHVPNTDTYRLNAAADPLDSARAIERLILAEGPETVSAVIVEPVQNNGGSITAPPGYFDLVREICDRHGVLLLSDEVICAWGRLGEMFGHQRVGYQPDIVATAKGLTSAYSPMGAVLASERVLEPFVGDSGSIFAHGFTFSGHPVSARVASANIDIIEREDLCGHVREAAPRLRARLEGLRDISIVGDVRGDGFLQSIELVADQTTRERLPLQLTTQLVGDALPRVLRERGLICRVDGRTGTPVLTLAPPLIAGDEQFDEIEAALRAALTAAEHVVRSADQA